MSNQEGVTISIPPELERHLRQIWEGDIRADWAMNQLAEVVRLLDVAHGPEVCRECGGALRAQREEGQRYRFQIICVRGHIALVGQAVSVEDAQHTIDQHCVYLSKYHR